MKIACPAPEALQSYLAGSGEGQAREDLSRHVDGCATCQAELDKLSNASQLRAALTTTELGDFQTESGLHRVLQEWRQNVPGASAEITTGFVASADTGMVSPNLNFLAPAQAGDELGRLGGYRVQKLLGQGGMGLVFAAEDLQLKRPVALKVMQPELVPSAGASQRFLREARAAAALRDDHIVTIYQVGEAGGVLFLAMELLQGETLDERVRREARLPVADVLRIGRETALGLAAAHDKGLIHRDIKPGNIWLESIVSGHLSVVRTDRTAATATDYGPRTTDYRVKILDFGLARQEDGDARLTQSGATLGTPHYMAPEQAAGEQVDQRADLFALGCVLYRMATGKVPFSGSNTRSVLKAVMFDAPQSPRELAPDLPPALADLIVRLLAKDPKDRPPTARGVAESLATIERDLEAAAARTPKPKRRRPVLLVASLLLAAVTGAVLLAGPAAVYRFATNQGQLVIETDDPNIEVTVKRNGALVEIVDKTTGHQITLKAGAYELEITKGKEGLTLKTNQFTLARGGKQIVKVRLEPQVVAANEAGWTQLFNGKDLDGWFLGEKQAWPGTWTVEHGLLVGKDRAILCSKRKFADFQCRLRAKFNANGQGAFAFRGTHSENTFVTIGNQEPGRRTGALVHFLNKFEAVSPMEQKLVPPDTWFNLEVIVRGKHVLAKVNGTTTVDMTFDRLRTDGGIRLDTWAPGSVLHVQKVEIKELPAADPPAAAAVAAPFVLARNEWAEQKFASLADAVAAARSDDTIEIRGDGPFQVTPLKLGAKALRLRAGAGFVPVLRMLGEGAAAEEPFLQSWAALNLEGLVLERVQSVKSDNHVHIRVHRAPLRAGNCRFHCTSPQTFVALNAIASPRFEVRNCLFLGNWSGAAGASTPDDGGATIIDNNLFRNTGHAVLLSPGKSRRYSMALTRNTSGDASALLFVPLPSLPTGITEPPGQIQLEDNVSKAVMHSDGFPKPEDAASFEKDFMGVLRKSIAWRVNRQLFSDKSKIMTFSQNIRQDKTIRSIDAVNDWASSLAVDPTGVIQGSIHLAGAAKLADLKVPLELIHPADFRLANDSAGKGAGPGGKDLGADVDLVGPGPAYERWKQTPDYQKWLKDSGQKT